MHYTLEELKKEDFDKWNEFVKENKLTIFHTIKWKKVLESSFGFKPIYYIVKNENNEVVGVAPAFICRNFFKKAIVSMPFFEYGGPFVKEGYKESYKTIFNKYKKLVDNGEIDFVKIRSLQFDEDYGKIGFNKQLEAYDFYLDIEGKNFEDIWNSFTKDSGIRTEFNKSVRNGVKTKTEKAPEILYNLVVKKDAKLGSPSFTKKFYLNVIRFLGSNSYYVTSYLEDNLLASMVSLKWGDELLLHQMGSDASYFNKSSTDILFVEQIRFAIENRLKKVDFGRSKLDSGHSFFKEKYQCAKRDLHDYYYPADFSEDRYKGRGFGQKLIKKLPWLFTKTFFGGWLRKNIGL